jgi:hypothetical protein
MNIKLTSVIHLTWVTFTTVGAKVQVLNICTGAEMPQYGNCSQVAIVYQMHDSLEWSTLLLLPGGGNFSFRYRIPTHSGVHSPLSLMDIGSHFNEVKTDVP